MTMALCTGQVSSVEKSTGNDGKRPNILVIMTDQQRWDALGCSGNGVIKTPNIDRLARSGVRFSRAVTPCPVSGPARTSILTGRAIEKSGVRLNPDVEKSDLPGYRSFDEILTAHGYTAECHGKFHSPHAMAAVYRNPSVMGYEGSRLIIHWEDVYRLIQQKYVPQREIIDGEQFDCSFYDATPYRPNPMDKRYGMAPQRPPVPKGDVKKLHDYVQPDCHGTLDLSPEYTITAVQGRETIDALQRLRDKPFVITCSFHAPHSPILPSEPYASMYEPTKMPIPASISDKMENNPYRASNGRLGPGMDAYADPLRIGYMIADYYGFVTEIDAWVGRILDQLDRLELTRNTVVIFVSDHGEMLGSHGMREKNVFLEESVRVPLIIRYPGTIPAGRVIDTPISLLGIYPTLMELTGIKDEVADCPSLMGLIRSGRPRDDFAISEWTSAAKNVPNIMITTSRWKLMLSYADDSGRCDALFDLKKDPYEMINLLGTNPAKREYKARAEELQKKLAGYLTRIGHPKATDVGKRIIVK
ncbi:hypothetical protein FACS1894159_04300 [Bacteroidia bacterium]|nr:hypothetical protein FACS1894159_04300 [Bacteroidia bacterium]